MKISKILFFSLFLTILMMGTWACTFDKNEDLVDCSFLEKLEVVSVQSTVCGLASGTIEVAATVNQSFNGEISYTINGGNTTTTPTFENLLAGTYEITASLNQECTKTVSVQVENEDGLNITINASPADCGTANGKIEIATNGAIGAVTFMLDGVEQSQNTFNNLASGKYEVNVTDDANCSISQEVKINSKVVISDIQAIINTNCALSGCHGGNVSPNLTTADNIKNAAIRIGARTGNQTMPPTSSGMSLNAAEIDAIACWVADNN